MCWHLSEKFDNVTLSPSSERAVSELLEASDPGGGSSATLAMSTCKRDSVHHTAVPGNEATVFEGS